jgi:hypothetical protein
MEFPTARYADSFYWPKLVEAFFMEIQTSFAK